MFKYGFELECWLVTPAPETVDYSYIPVSPILFKDAIGYDDNGYLAEIRTYGAGKLAEQYGNILAGMSKIYQATKDTTTLVCTSTKDVDLSTRTIKAVQACTHGNMTVKCFDAGIQNIYSKTVAPAKFKTSFQINISYEQRILISNEERVVNIMFDFAPIIRKLDKTFTDDIKYHGRKPGCYRIKQGVNGMYVEYMSLPAQIVWSDPVDVLGRLQSVLK